MRRVNNDNNQNDRRFTNTVSCNGNDCNNNHDPHNNHSHNNHPHNNPQHNNPPNNRRVREITCHEAARAVYDLSCEGKALLEESQHLQHSAEKLIEEAFLLAEAIERSCHDDCW